MDSRKADMMSMARLDAEMKELRKENHELRQYILALQGEVYGARLAAKYLDKELAGRYVMPKTVRVFDRHSSMLGSNFNVNLN